MSADVYAMVTDQIVSALEKGVIPWRKPWDAAGVMPTNLVSKRAYRGINVMLLSMQPFGSPYWLSFKQAKSLGGCVRKGEKGTRIVFFKPFEVENEDGTKKTIPLLRYSTVFNVEQCDGIDVPEVERDEFDPIERAEEVISAWKAHVPLTYGGDRAFYVPSQDRISLPEREFFRSAEGFYGTAFHEMSHSTGHKSRLDRDLSGTFGTKSYAREELVAEMGAAMVAACCGIDLSDTIDNHAAYIKSWLSALADDPKLVIWAASRAQKAADLILQSAGIVSSAEPVAA